MIGIQHYLKFRVGDPVGVGVAPAGAGLAAVAGICVLTCNDFINAINCTN